MKGNDEVVQVLQDVLCAELTAINQYFIHARMNENWGFYAAGSRGYKMPELDALLNATAQGQVDVTEPKEVRSVEGGVKTQIGRGAITLGGFYTQVKNIVGQGLEVVNGVTTWVTKSSPDNRSYGAELEAVVLPHDLDTLAHRLDQAPGPTTG